MAVLPRLRASLADLLIPEQPTAGRAVEQLIHPEKPDHGAVTDTNRRFPSAYPCDRPGGRRLTLYDIEARLTTLRDRAVGGPILRRLIHPGNPPIEVIDPYHFRTRQPGVASEQLIAPGEHELRPSLPEDAHGAVA